MNGQDGHRQNIVTHAGDQEHGAGRGEDPQGEGRRYDAGRISGRDVRTRHRAPALP